VELQAEAPFDHTVVWTDPPRPMVCLEPWTARRGELGLALAPGEQLELNCSYRLVSG
jgi:galactose mutarotase-like enzyme